MNLSAAHLHDLNLSVSLALADVLARLDEVANELSRTRRAQLRRVVLLSNEHSARINRQTQCTVSQWEEREQGCQIQRLTRVERCN